MLEQAESLLQELRATAVAASDFNDAARHSLRLALDALAQVCDSPTSPDAVKASPCTLHC